MLAIEELSCAYKADVPVLEHISLTMDAGESVAVLGPSGSGKSTLLHAVAGFVPIMRGRIVVNRVDMTNRAPAERRVRLAFQHPALIQHFTVAQNIMPPYAAGMHSTERMRELVAWLRIDHLLNAYPDELSGGERQRVECARVFVKDDPILLLDEPFSSLDAPLRLELLRALFARQLPGVKKETLIVYVTHDQREIECCTRVVLMEQGRIVEIGSPAHVRASSATKSFFT